jgi:hypothetical protein
MRADERAHATLAAVNDLVGAFLLDPATHARGAELGFPGVDFDIVGRAGVLGRVAPDVAAATLVFFEPATVRRAWRAGSTRMDPRDVSAVFAACAHTWARGLPASLDAARLAALAGAVVAGAPGTGAPLFAGWRAMPEPEENRAVAVHRLLVLRELRASLHAIAVQAAGVAPREIMLASDPERAARYGWTDGQEPAPAPAIPDVPPLAVRRRLAGDIAGRLLSGSLACLGPDEQDELRALTGEALDAVHRPATA